MIFDNVGPEKRLQIVRFRDLMLFSPKVAQFSDLLRVTGSYCKIVHMDAEVDAFAVAVDLEKLTGITC